MTIPRTACVHTRYGAKADTVKLMVEEFGDGEDAIRAFQLSLKSYVWCREVRG